MAFFNIPLIDPVARTTKRKETEKRATGMRERGTRRTQILKDTLKGLVPEREPIDRSQIPSPFPGLGQPGAMSMGGTQFPTLPTLPGVQSRGQSIQDIFGNIQPGGQSLLPQGSGGAFPLPAVNVQPSQAQTLPIVGNQPATSPVPLGGAQAQVAQPFTTPSAETVNNAIAGLVQQGITNPQEIADALNEAGRASGIQSGFTSQEVLGLMPEQAQQQFANQNPEEFDRIADLAGFTSSPGEVINTGNPQLDSLLNSLPQIQEALGIGVETEAQRTQREGQEQSLNRLISLQEQLIQAQAPDDTIADLDRTIQQQMKALEETTPERLLATQPTLGEEGITQGQLLRESASRRDPIARTLSDLLSSRSILADTQQRKQQSLQNKFTGLQNIASLQEALGALQPETGIAPGVQSGILQGIVGQAFEDPLDRQLKQAQIANINSQISDRDREALGIGQLRALGNEGFAFAERPDLTAQEQQKVGVLDSGLRLVDQIEQLYFDAVGEDVQGGILAKPLGFLRGLTRGIGIPFTGKTITFKQGIQQYLDFLDSNRAPVAKGLKGEVGNLTKEEQENALKSFPGKNTTPQVAREKFVQIRKQITDNLSTLGQFAQPPQFGDQESQDEYIELSDIDFTF